MGMRLNIQNESSDKMIYGKHKFYGYVDYEVCKESFDFLYPFLSSQDEMFDYGEFENSEKESYELLCALPSTGDIRMDAESFTVFMKKYLCDLINSDRSLEAIKDAVLISEQTISEPGFKILSWG